jgi:hypothetical protein
MILKVNVSAIKIAFLNIHKEVGDDTKLIATKWNRFWNSISQHKDTELYLELNVNSVKQDIENV